MHAPEFWRRGGPIPFALSPIAGLWQALSAARQRRAEPARVAAPVICIGNLVAGGAGKTPVALAVAGLLRRRGCDVQFLSRGYGGSIAGPARVDPDRHSAADVGDEPLLLAAAAPTWVSADRVAGARAAVAGGAAAIVMDDGFQNPSLHKDLSILVFDGGYGLGNGRVMPAGPLREAAEAGLSRAGAVVVIGEDSAGIASWVGARLPVLHARFVPTANADDIAGRRVVAFAGIGRPEKFFRTLAEIGCDLIDARPFPDHHRYAADEVMALVERAAASDALVVTTEKDAVRLPADARGMVRVLRVALEWQDEAALDRLVGTAIGESG